MCMSGCVLLVLFIFQNLELIHADENISDFDVTYSGSVSLSSGFTRPQIYFFKLPVVSDVVRVSIKSNGSTSEPLLVVVRETSAILSWQVPLCLKKECNYSEVARTLCPVVNASGSALSTKYRKTFQDQIQNDDAIQALPSPFSSFASENDSGTVIAVEMSSASVSPVSYDLNAHLLHEREFRLQLGVTRQVDVGPALPQYFRFSMPSDVESVIVKVNSVNDTEKTCMVLSVQPIECPVFDLEDNVQFTGTYQTMTTIGAITVSSSRYNDFYVVLIVKPNDHECLGLDDDHLIYSNLVGSTDRLKRLNIIVEETLSDHNYVVAVVAAIASFLLVWFFIIILSYVFYYRDMRDVRYMEARQAAISAATQSSSDERSRSGSGRSSVTPRNYGSIEVPATSTSVPVPDPETNASLTKNLFADDRRRAADRNRSSSPGDVALELLAKQTQTTNRSGTSSRGQDTMRRRYNSDSSSDGVESEYDPLTDAATDKNVIRAKADLCVADLARKPYRAMNLKYQMYNWNLITIAVFYLLPVIQLVLTYQKVVNDTGNQDSCYYNFLCTRPLWNIIAFNNVFSNIGYVMLGVFFLLVVYNRDVAQTKLIEQFDEVAMKFGIPGHYGLFYAIGLGLVVEGVLSACYHVCPSYTNFQFDTAFMYMIGCLGMLRIYQMRHPDINAHSHIAYSVMAGVILLAVVGVIYGQLAFWIIFSICYTLLVFMLSAEFYYKSRWRIDKGIFRRIRQQLAISRWYNWCIPQYCDRFLFLFLVNGLNFSWMVYGAMYQPPDFPSYLIAVFFGNWLLYMLFYIAMKIKHHERILPRPLVYLVLATVVWILSMFFFLNKSTSWMVTAAQSREYNKECILLNFYDHHDIWHFLSALSMFFTCMLLLTIDDDLYYIPQDKIKVF